MTTLTPTQVSFIISTVIGMIAPYVTAIFNNRKFSDKVRVLISLVVALILAVIQCAVTGQLKSVGSLAYALAVIWPTSQLIYKTVAVKFGVQDLEAITSGLVPTATSTTPLPTTSVADAEKAMSAPSADVSGETVPAITPAEPVKEGQ